jgi:hypothetical protein
MATMPQIDVQVRVEYVADPSFPGLTPDEIIALPSSLYRAGLDGTLKPNEVRAWKQRCEGERIDRAVEEWRKAKLAATPEPDPLDRLFEPRTA